LLGRPACERHGSYRWRHRRDDRRPVDIRHRHLPPLLDSPSLRRRDGFDRTRVAAFVEAGGILPGRALTDLAPIEKPANVETRLRARRAHRGLQAQTPTPLHGPRLATALDPY